MSRIITDLPDDIDPVTLIKQKLWQCPICGGKPKDLYYNHDYERMDATGNIHKFIGRLNKYIWHQYYGLVCEKCGCEWDTGWYPADHKMFEITVDGDKDTVRDAVNNMLKNLGIAPSMVLLSEEDLIEIQDRFGDYVRFVIEDMMSGEEKRWDTTTGDNEEINYG